VVWRLLAFPKRNQVMLTMEAKAKPVGRRHPFARAAKPSPLVLQARDEVIIEAVYDYGILSGEQIEQLIGFGCTTRRNARLRVLFDHRFLDRKFLPTLQGSPKALYLPGRRAIEVLSRTLGVDSQRVALRIKRIRETKELFLNHRLQVNEARLAFSLGIKANPDTRLDLWQTEPELSGSPLIPDAYCRYIYQEKRWSFFLELDRSTESHKRFKAKLETYLDYGFSGKYGQQFGGKFFRVLIAAPTQARASNLKKLTEKITDKMFWFAVIGDIRSETVFQPIWHRPRRDGRFALNEE
jgi:protein involved in plasmid replication-relaxation